MPLQQVRDVLHKRMNMKNPHKVWLATHLADDILKKCPDTIGPIKSDIYQVTAFGTLLQCHGQGLPCCFEWKDREAKRSWFLVSGPGCYCWEAVGQVPGQLQGRAACQDARLCRAALQQAGAERAAAHPEDGQVRPAHHPQPDLSAAAAFPTAFQLDHSVCQQISCILRRMVSLAPTQQSTKSQQRTRPLNAKGEPLKPERTNSGGSSERAEKERAEKRSEGGAAADAAKAAAKSASANGSGSGSSRGSARAGGEAGARTKRTKMTFEEATQNVTKALGVAGSHTSMIQVQLLDMKCQLHLLPLLPACTRGRSCWLQDLVMNIADGKSEAPDFERQFLGELSEEVVSFRTAFESLVRRLHTTFHALFLDSSTAQWQQNLPAEDDHRFQHGLLSKRS